jgi:hypothetical protein
MTHPIPCDTLPKLNILRINFQLVAKSLRRTILAPLQYVQRVLRFQCAHTTLSYFGNLINDILHSLRRQSMAFGHGSRNALPVVCIGSLDVKLHPVHLVVPLIICDDVASVQGQAPLRCMDVLLQPFLRSAGYQLPRIIYACKMVLSSFDSDREPLILSFNHPCSLLG